MTLRMAPKLSFQNKKEFTACTTLTKKKTVILWVRMYGVRIFVSFYNIASVVLYNVLR